jgi:hypothetical protein
MRRHFRPIFLPAAEDPAGNRAPEITTEVVAIKRTEKRPA